MQWLTTAYMLVAGVLIPTSAFFITKFKSRHVFITAMSIFSVGTILAGFAPTFPLLLTARIVQAIGASVLSPLLMNVMLVSFSREQRGKAMGIYGLITMFAPSIGPTISGLIVDSLGWRMLFFTIAPFAVLSLGFAIWKLENVLEQRDASIDAFSVALSTIGFSSVLYGLSGASTKGWADLSVYGLILIGIAALVLFILRQFKLEKPLLDLRVYKYPMFALSSVLSTILSMIMYSAMILLPYYMQSVQGYTTLKSGLIMLPGSLVMAACMPFAGRIYDKVGALPLAMIGFPMIGIASYFMSILQVDTSAVYVAIWFGIRSVGNAMIMMPIQANGLNQLPRRLNPSGTAVNSTVQQVAGAIGTAVFVTLMTTYAATRGKTLLAEAKVQLGDSLTTVVQEGIQRQALLDAINYTSFVSIGLVVIGIIFSFFVRKRIYEETNASEHAA